MIKLDLKNAITKEALKKYNDIVKKISIKMEKLETLGFEYLGWKDLPFKYNKLELKEIKRIAKKLIKEQVEILVVVGIGGSFAGTKAGLEMIKGEYPNDSNIEIIFVGESISSTNLAQKLNYVKEKNFAINVISKSGTTIEPSIAFRLFRKLLEKKVGKNNASKFIIATTSSNKGSLLKIASENKYKTFFIPDNIGGRYSVLTSVGLFPLACSGININEIIKGAQIGCKRFSSPILLENEAYQYAVARIILGKKYPIELMVQYESQMKAFSEWWKQLAGESEGKNLKGLFPASAVFSTDLHSLGQFVQEGSKVLFETVLTTQTPNMDISLFEEKNNFDKLNYLSDLSIHQINHVAFQATTEAHVKVGKVPNIHIEFSTLDEFNFGQLVIFFQRAIAMTSYLLGVNPFNQPGVEVYKQNMFKTLKRPE